MSFPGDPSYNIKSGDNFWKLENQWGLTHGTLQALNPSVEPTKLQIGQEINKPVTANEPARRDDGSGRRRYPERRRDNSRSRGLNLSVFDDRGKEILARWLNGSGQDLIVENGRWGVYMRENELLQSKIKQILQDDAKTRTPGKYKHSGHMAIQNGYFTGYEMLHGTNANVGGFAMSGAVQQLKGNKLQYDLRLEWHDIIDPNFVYDGDKWSSKLLLTLYDAKDYNIHIYWYDTYKIQK